MHFSERSYRRAITWSLIGAAATAVFVAVVIFAADLPGDGVVTIGEVIAALLTGSASFVAFALLRTRKWRRRRRLLVRPFPSAWEDILAGHVDFYRMLSGSERSRFRQQVQIFLGETQVTGVDTAVDDLCQVLVGASAVIPVFGYPDWEYDRMVEVLIYPGGFDEDYKVEGRMSPLIGMVPAQSSEVILSKPALLRAFEPRGEAAHVGIHEFLHKVDGADGAVDGTPRRLLADPALAEEWSRMIETHTRSIEEGRTDIDPYAAKNPAEFFAVVGEYFFAAPSRQARWHPELYRTLARMFRQDPARVHPRPIAV